jgi:hypothetical protein
MTDQLKLILGVMASLFRSRATLEAGKPGLAATGQCASSANAAATAPQQYGSFSIRMAQSLVSIRP